MDAHTFYPPSDLSGGVERLQRGDVARVGRRMPPGEVEADTAFTGLLRRTMPQNLGGWDEGWSVNEDGELAARVREAGGRIICILEMAARYVPRDTLRGLARQYWRYGWDRAMTSRRHPESMRRSHLPAARPRSDRSGGHAGQRGARASGPGRTAHQRDVRGRGERAARGATLGRDAPPVGLRNDALRVGAGFVANCAKESVPLSALRESPTGGGPQPRPHPAGVA